MVPQATVWGRYTSSIQRDRMDMHEGLSWWCFQRFYGTHEQAEGKQTNPTSCLFFHVVLPLVCVPILKLKWTVCSHCFSPKAAVPVCAIPTGPRDRQSCFTIWSCLRCSIFIFGIFPLWVCDCGASGYCRFTLWAKLLLVTLYCLQLECWWGSTSLSICWDFGLEVDLSMLLLPHYSKNTLKLTFAFMFFLRKEVVFSVWMFLRPRWQIFTKRTSPFV